ncbi:hypothetical protein [Leucobacter musarum]|uniref:hypothetical protein n=1 Tax=Leucobacter musarum TaxID=1930747 RepID=UPI0006A7BB2E|nr:hypothetical protein [Leucobacter musarum]
MSNIVENPDVRKLRERLRAAWDYELQNHPFASGDFENPYGADEPSFDELIQPRLPEFDSANERPLRYADQLFAAA